MSKKTIILILVVLDVVLLGVVVLLISRKRAHVEKLLVETPSDTTEVQPTDTLNLL